MLAGFFIVYLSRCCKSQPCRAATRIFEKKSVQYLNTLFERKGVVMNAIEFETDIQDGVVKIPEKYEHLKNTHARIVVLYDNALENSTNAEKQVGLDFASVKAPSLAAHDGVEYQRSLRDEW